MMFGDGSLTFREVVAAEPLPLATLHDAVLFGAHAVNAYVDVSRMTQNVDVLSTFAHTFVQALLGHLSQRFHLAVQVRDFGKDKGLRLYQVAKPKNRNLVDVRQVPAFPPSQWVHGARQWLMPK